MITSVRRNHHKKRTKAERRLSFRNTAQHLEKITTVEELEQALEHIAYRSMATTYTILRITSLFCYPLPTNISTFDKMIKCKRRIFS